MGNVNYSEAARRHQSDSEVLRQHGSVANAGQLLGFSMECGLKALLIAIGVGKDTDGSVSKAPGGQPGFRLHMPMLSQRIDSDIAISGVLIPDTVLAAHYLAMVPGRRSFASWSTDHRYWGDAVFPIAELSQWKVAVAEMIRMLDQAKLDGVL